MDGRMTIEEVRDELESIGKRCQIALLIPDSMVDLLPTVIEDIAEYSQMLLENFCITESYCEVASEPVIGHCWKCAHSEGEDGYLWCRVTQNPCLEGQVCPSYEPKVSLKRDVSANGET